MSPFQGRYRLSTNLDFSKQIPYRLRHRCLRRCANIRRSSEAKHCSSLCSQSEGGEYCGGQALKIQQSHAPERWSCSLRVRGPHFASKVSYNAGAPSSAANNSLIRVIRCYAVQGSNLRPILRRKKRVIRPFKVRIGSLYQVFDLRPRVALPSAASRVTFGREQHDSRPQIDNV